jgi:hypothetical protein
MSWFPVFHRALVEVIMTVHQQARFGKTVDEARAVDGMILKPLKQLTIWHQS